MSDLIGNQRELTWNIEALANAVILHAIDDLDTDVLNDEGALNWIDRFDIDHKAIVNGINEMPIHDGLEYPNSKCCKGKAGCQRVGTHDARPAIRHLMEALDARAESETEIEMEVQFEQVALAELEAPTSEELKEVEAFVEELELEEWDDTWKPNFAK